jgi:hypothetical protein
MRSVDVQEERVRNWLLAILRFAVTLEPTDRALVLAMAKEMDRSGLHATSATFAFFVRTSRELCNAIADVDDPNRAITLSRHFGRIYDRRLRRALEAASEFEQPTANSISGRKRDRGDLWRGL